MSRSKQQGTSHETALVNWFSSFEQLEAYRLPEGGANDLGDLEVSVEGQALAFIVEAKATERLNVTRALAKAKRKAEGRPTALIWKRLVKTGKKIRQPDGEKVVAVIDLETFTTLLRLAGRKEIR